jgi:hypothetical protein
VVEAQLRAVVHHLPARTPPSRKEHQSVRAEKRHAPGQ